MNSTNTTHVTDVVIANTFEVFSRVCRVLWLCGVAASSAGLMVQLGIFLRARASRQRDERVLAMLSLARIINAVCEYLILYDNTLSGFIKDAVFAVYIQTDFALVCWMFVFSKNVYNKVVLVFTITRCGFITISFIIFFASLPLGLICVYLLKTSTYYLNVYLKTYGFIKFVIVVINALIFVEILSVAYSKGANTNRSLAHFVKAAVYAFILVCTTSLQVFATDMLSLLLGDNMYVIYSFCVINAYQVVLVTIIFVTLARSKQREAVSRTTASVRLSELS